MCLCPWDLILVNIYTYYFLEKHKIQLDTIFYINNCMPGKLKVLIFHFSIIDIFLIFAREDFCNQLQTDSTLFLILCGFIVRKTRSIFYFLSVFLYFYNQPIFKTQFLNQLFMSALHKKILFTICKY